MKPTLSDVKLSQTHIGGQTIHEIIPNGTLENMKNMPSLCLFGGDKDQKPAFVQIVSAFVIKLHEKAFDSTNLRTRCIVMEN
jgi:hypothetical protein